MPYAIASLDIGGYIDEYYCQVYDCTSANINSNYHDDSKSNFRDDREKNSRPSRRPSSEYHRRLRRSNSYNDTEKREISYLTTPSKANSNSSNSVHYSPTPEPTPKPMWAVNWNWLPGFNGGDGPILEIKRGKGDYRNSLYIVGAFQNYPSIVIWNENSDYFQSNTSILGGSTAIKGLVTSVSHVLLPYQADQPISMPIGPVSNKRDYYTILILTCSVLAGVILGLGVAAGYYSNKTSYSAIPTIDIDNENDNNGEVKVGMSLMTLTDVRQPDYVDFKDCFERAMRARHLPTHESLFVINPKEIVLSRVIGEGSFGRVWSGQWGNTAVAVKEFVFAQAAVVGGSIERNNIIEEFVGEAGIMACLRHPKILQLYGCTMTMQAIWIVSELCVRGSLRMLLNDRSTELSQLTMLSISLDIADGLHYLHTRSPPIIHRDMKSHNVFIHEQSPGKFVAKIGDWGSARAIALTGAKSMTQGVGTACWLSPEVIYNAHFSKASDVYAFGIILWEIYTRQEIYEGMTAAQVGYLLV